MQTVLQPHEFVRRPSVNTSLPMPRTVPACSRVLGAHRSRCPADTEHRLHWTPWRRMLPLLLGACKKPVHAHIAHVWTCRSRSQRVPRQRMKCLRPRRSSATPTSSPRVYVRELTRGPRLCTRLYARPRPCRHAGARVYTDRCTGGIAAQREQGRAAADTVRARALTRALYRSSYCRVSPKIVG